MSACRPAYSIVDRPARGGGHAGSVAAAAAALGRRHSTYERVDTMAAPRLGGVCVKYSVERGYGFIRPISGGKRISQLPMLVAYIIWKFQRLKL